MLEVGTGATAFEPLVPEQILPLHPGAQGCCHFYVHARMIGMNPGMGGVRHCGNPLTLFGATLDSGEPVDLIECADIVGYVSSGAGDAVELPRGQAIIVNPDLLSTLPGRRVLVKVEVVDADGRYAVGEQWIVVGERIE
jgi:hypothetical protein